MNIPRATYLLLLAGATAWCAAIVSAPLLMNIPGPLSSAGGVIYEFFRPLCHQMGERSFHIHGAPFAVCARCSAIYGGFLVGALCYPLVRSLQEPLLPPRWVLAAALAPMLLDVACGMLGVYDNTNVTRLISGALFGFATPWFIIPGLLEAARQYFIPPTPSPTPTIAKG
jgi:uncharacterized membrane protein